jgi:hypothetical protein
VVLIIEADDYLDPGPFVLSADTHNST